MRRIGSDRGTVGSAVAGSPHHGHMSPRIDAGQQTVAGTSDLTTSKWSLRQRDLGLRNVYLILYESMACRKSGTPRS